MYFATAVKIFSDVNASFRNWLLARYTKKKLQSIGQFVEERKKCRTKNYKFHHLPFSYAEWQN